MSEFFRKLFLPITAPLDFVQKYFKALLFLLIVAFLFSASGQEPKSGANLARLYLYGPILDASFFLDEMKKVEDENIKGVLVVVDSPGGLVAPSIEIGYALRDLAQKKKIVVYASGTMASGSYYASIFSHKIISNPGSLIGSIGVIFEGLNLEELAKKIGIKEQVVKAGKYKETGTMMREWSAHEKEELEKLVRAQYELFVGDVAASRKLDPKNHTQFADARVFTAGQAKEMGLIDEIGIIRDAENALIAMSGVMEPVWLEDSEFDKFMKKLVNMTTTKVVSLLFFPKMW